MPATNRIDHTTCSHEASREGRAACRKDRAARLVLAEAIVDYFDNKSDNWNDWLAKGARRFDASLRDRSRGQYEGLARDIPDTDRLALATSLLNYFFPADREARASYYRDNGYTITSDPATLRSIICRAFS